MSVKNTSRILSSIIKSNQAQNQNPISSNKQQENTQTVIYLKNFGNLSGGIIKKKLATPSRSVRSISGMVGSVGSFRRGIPAGDNNFFSNEDRNNQTISLSNIKSNVNNNSFLFSSNNTPAISKNKNIIPKNNNINLFTNTTSASTGNMANNLNSNLNSDNSKNKEITNFASIINAKNNNNENINI